MTGWITAKKKPTGSNKTFMLAIITLVAMVAILASVVSARAASDLLLMHAPKLPKAMAVSAVFLDIATAGDRLVAVGEYGLILTSDDSGATWQQAEVPTSVTLTAGCFPTAQNGWAVGHDGVVLHSQDGGQHWQIQLSGLAVNEKALVQMEHKVSEIRAALDTVQESESDELDARLEDLELLLSDMRVPVEDHAPTPLMDVLFLDEQKGFAVGAFGMILKTRDGGNTWEPIVDRMNNIDGYHYYGIERVRADDKDVLFVAGEGGTLLRSTDGGTNWVWLDSPYEGTFFGITAAIDAPGVIAYGLGGEAYRSNDLGERWQRLEKPGNNDHQTISGAAALSDGGFVLTTNNGRLFLVSKTGTGMSRLPDQVPGSMAAAEADNGDLIVAGIMGIERIRISDRKGE